MIWIIFAISVIFLLILDLGLFSNNKAPTFSSSIKLSIFYIISALLFGLFILHDLGQEKFYQYLTAFVVEKSLSIDNIFIISMIFDVFAIPMIYRRKVLFWGIIGVIIFRAILIASGSVIISKFAPILYLFSAFLIVTGIKMLLTINHNPDIKNSFISKFITSHFRITESLRDGKFIVKANGLIYGTPLLLALIVIEFMDLIFALDSIPAIFSITTDSYIIFTSNIFAILGLRALYFALESIIHKFCYLKHALAVVLIFIGSKIFLEHIFQIEEVPAFISLLITIFILIIGVLLSMYKNKSNVSKCDVLQ